MISIIIPTYNEESHIGETIRYLQQASDSELIKEIIVSDGGSSDQTVQKANKRGAIAVLSTKKGRAAQMNFGASLATGSILYFLHADSKPPLHFTKDILSALEKRYTSGCYRLQFDYRHWFLKANCWFTRFNVNAVRFGDQSLFATKEVFERSGRFREDLLLMEDQEIIHRLKKWGKFKVMNGYVTTSARKYLDNGIYRMQAIFFRIWLLYYLGYSQEQLLKLYRKLISQNKM